MQSTKNKSKKHNNKPIRSSYSLFVFAFHEFIGCIRSWSFGHCVIHKLYTPTGNLWPFLMEFAHFFSASSSSVALVFTVLCVPWHQIVVHSWHDTQKRRERKKTCKTQVFIHKYYARSNVHSNMPRCVCVVFLRDRKIKNSQFAESTENGNAAKRIHSFWIYSIFFFLRVFCFALLRHRHRCRLI